MIKDSRLYRRIIIRFEQEIASAYGTRCAMADRCALMVLMTLGAIMMFIVGGRRGVSRFAADCGLRVIAGELDRNARWRLSASLRGKRGQ